MRPDRAIVKKAILDGEGSLTKAAILLGCTRQTLYTWIYQHGLEKLAGIRMDRRDGLDTRERKDTIAGNQLKRLSNQTTTGGPNLRVVAAQAAVDQQIPATMKLPESLWKRARIKAIRDGVTVSSIVQQALEESLAADEAGGRKVRGKTNGGDGA